MPAPRLNADPLNADPPSPHLQARCAEAFAAVRHFEGRYCVADEALPASYLAARQEWFGTAASFAGAFGLKDEVLHDALLLLDRAVAAGGEQLLALDAGALITSCLLIAARQGAHATRACVPLPPCAPVCGAGLVCVDCRLCLVVCRRFRLNPGSRQCSPAHPPPLLLPQPASTPTACPLLRGWSRPQACLPPLWRPPRPLCGACCRETPQPSLVSE